MGLTAVAISGGVDSLAAALLLKQEGPVAGIHFKTGYHPVPQAAIRQMAADLDIPIHILDCQAAFQSEIVDYFIKTYQQGQTPNPCLVCNPIIKFGVVAEFARTLGADRVATGHYARIETGPDGAPRLMKGLDPKKDQSYFLAFLTQKQLAAAVFPLGCMTKTEVKQLVAEKGLLPASSSESQDVCFIRETSYTDFIACQTGHAPTPGPIEDVHGRRIGEHKGLHLFTVGQRRGINCPAREPYYVLRIDPENNRLVVGFKEDLSTSQCRVSGVNWIQPQTDDPFKAVVRVRYRGRAGPAKIYPANSNTALIRFETPQSATAPGQGAVFYLGDEVAGAGWIDP